MRRFLLLPLLFAPVLSAEGPEFEVASIKPFGSPSNDFVMLGAASGGPGTADPTHIQWNAANLRSMLQNAFDVKNYQLAGVSPVTAMFDISATVPEGATKEDVRTMWKNLLISRFGLKFHVEQREFQVDELIVGPRGHKLIENKDAEAPPPDPNTPFTPPKLDRDGKPTLERPGMIMMMNSGPNGITGRGVAKAQPISALATLLSNRLGHPVLDKTGLTGKYDFTIEFAPSNIRFNGGPIAVPPGATPAPAAAATPDLGLELPEAVQQQLGLRLTKGKGMLDVIVVDEIQASPTEN